jgi:tripartite-type tricarboxylate transporter receptor subunit TctC
MLTIYGFLRVAAVLIVIAEPALAQKFPSRNIQLVVPLAAGSTTDVAARLIAQHAAISLGTQIIIENKPGASTMLGSAAVAKADPDGHTLLMGASSLTVNQNLFKSVPYDTERDFAPVSLLVTAPVVLVVNPATGVKTFSQFQQRFSGPDGVTVATSGPGTMLGLATEVFKLKSGMNVRTIVYRGGGPALTDVIAGHVNAMFGTPVIKQNIDAGEVNALAVSGPSRLILLADVPTFEEVGLPLPEIDTGAWFGILAPAGTPREVVGLLNRAFNAVLLEPELRLALLNLGMVPRGTSPEEFSTFIHGEISRWPGIFTAAGIKPE